MTKSLSEIEVIYLKDGMYNGRKYAMFDDDKAEEVYMKTCAKYKHGGALVIMRKNNEVIKTYRHENKT
jgi:hypothetical protein